MQAWEINELFSQFQTNNFFDCDFHNSLINTIKMHKFYKTKLTKIMLSFHA